MSARVRWPPHTRRHRPVSGCTGRWQSAAGSATQAPPARPVAQSFGSVSQERKSSSSRHTFTSARRRLSSRPVGVVRGLVGHGDRKAAARNRIAQLSGAPVSAQRSRRRRRHAPPSQVSPVVMSPSSQPAPSSRVSVWHSPVSARADHVGSHTRRRARPVQEPETHTSSAQRSPSCRRCRRRWPLPHTRRSGSRHRRCRCLPVERAVRLRARTPSRQASSSYRAAVVAGCAVGGGSAPPPEMDRTCPCCAESNSCSPLCRCRSRGRPRRPCRCSRVRGAVFTGRWRTRSPDRRRTSRRRLRRAPDRLAHTLAGGADIVRRAQALVIARGAVVERLRDATLLGSHAQRSTRRRTRAVNLAPVQTPSAQRRHPCGVAIVAVRAILSDRVYVPPDSGSADPTTQPASRSLQSSSAPTPPPNRRHPRTEVPINVADAIVGGTGRSTSSQTPTVQPSLA